MNGLRSETASGGRIKARYRTARTVAIVVILVVSAAVIYAAASYGRQRTEEQLLHKAAETLAVQAEILSGVLEKYRLLPPLLARQNNIAAIFRDDMPWPQRVARAQIKAEEIAGMSGAREVSFFWPDGTLLASARGIYKAENSGARELTETATQGRLGRMVVALSSADRAYAFSSGVRRDSRFLGIVVVYVGFEGIEATWSLSTNPIFISDENDRIILTNRHDWRLKTASNLFGIVDSGDYANLMRDLPLLKWQLHVLADLSPAHASAVTAGAIAAVICLLLGAGILLLLSRRELTERQLRKDRALALRLERIVRDRTRALVHTNESLSHEVEERRQAEEKLRQTQAELIQTAKLAVLGQMAATLSHEMNQPLAAMRTYAANARRFLELNRPVDASSTLARISAMVDRMAELSGALLSFSRKPGTESRPVSLESVIEEALILVRPRAAQAGVKLAVDKTLGAMTVLGGRIRLSQVFVNLVNNAIDAMKNRKGGMVRIAAKRLDDEIVVSISDNGPGIPDDLRSVVFDPFFTTKPQGEGIGVGLSIVYNIVQEFGGSIRLLDAPGTGATFEIRLKAAD